MRTRPRTSQERLEEERSVSSTSSEKREADVTAKVNDNGNARKRGATRENQHLPNRTSSLKEHSKQVTSGREVTLSVNYFRLKTTPNFVLTLCRGFQSLGHAGTRKKFVYDKKVSLGEYVCDGTNLIYMTSRLPSLLMTFQCTTREETMQVMTLKDNGRDIAMTEASVMQIFNIILRRAMDGLEMKLVGGNM